MCLPSRSSDSRDVTRVALGCGLPSRNLSTMMRHGDSGSRRRSWTISRSASMGKVRNSWPWQSRARRSGRYRSRARSRCAAPVDRRRAEDVQMRVSLHRRQAPLQGPPVGDVGQVGHVQGPGCDDQDAEGGILGRRWTGHGGQSGCLGVFRRSKTRSGAKNRSGLKRSSRLRPVLRQLRRSP